MKWILWTLSEVANLSHAFIQQTSMRPLRMRDVSLGTEALMLDVTHRLCSQRAYILFLFYFILFSIIYLPF